MVSKQIGFRLALLALLVVAMLGLPIAAAAQAGNGITSPAADATVTGKVDVKGNVGGPNFSKWQLDLLPGGDPNKAIFLAYGANPGAVAYALDTTALPDGTHALRLRNVRTSGNYDEYIAKFTIANKGAAKPAAAAAAAKDIVDTAVASGKFTTLVKAVGAAGLVDALKGTGPFTVFAPTDAAFAALPAGTLDSLLKDPAALKNVLLYHVLSGDVMAAQVKDGMTANTLEGAPVKFAVSNGAVKINDANIVTTDIKTSNGVIHVIDKVILPPTAAPAAAAAAVGANGITSPAANAAVSGTVDVKGNAGGPNFSKWQLDLLPGGNPNAAIFLALGSQPGAVDYSLDTTKWPDGMHALRLRNVRVDGNYDEYTRPFSITNQAKMAPASAAPTVAAMAPTAAVTATKDIVETAVAAGKFTTLVKAVGAAGLVDTLKGKGPFTVFAPTDAAFAALPAGTLDSLLKDPAALKKILLYHVLPGDVMAAQVKDGMTANTVEGAPVKFTVGNGVVKINDATIVTTDIKTSNGVIHVIDKVILPPQ